MTLEPRRVQHEFGKFRVSHGWIQCRSRSYPKRSYFHNVHSGCNTWIRPVSRYVNIPSIRVNRQDMCNESNVTASNSLELVSLSDDENQPKIKRKSHIVITERDRDASGEFCALQVGLTVDTTDDSYESDESTFQWEPTDRSRKNKQIINAEDDGDDSDSSEAALHLPLHDMKSYRKKRITVSPVLTLPVTSRRRRVVSKRTDGNQAKRGRNSPVVPENRGPRKIICDMYGVRTVNYFYEPEDEPVDQTCARLGVRCSRLSDSDSDDVNEPPSPRNDSRETMKRLSESE